MGMFDEIRIHRDLYCCYCGNKFPNGLLWQTKDGEKLLNRYKSKESWDSKHPDIGYYKVSQTCEKCKYFTDVMLYNESIEHEIKTRTSYNESSEYCMHRSTNEHPNHIPTVSFWGDITFHNPWCIICQKSNKTSILNEFPVGFSKIQKKAVLEKAKQNKKANPERKSFFEMLDEDFWKSDYNKNYEEI